MEIFAAVPSVHTHPRAQAHHRIYLPPARRIPQRSCALSRAIPLCSTSVLSPPGAGMEVRCAADPPGLKLACAACSRRGEVALHGAKPVICPFERALQASGVVERSPISTLPCFVRRWCVRHPMHQHQSRRHLQRLGQPWCVAKCMLAGAAGGRPQQGSSMYTCVQGTMSHTPEICRHKPPSSPSCPLCSNALCGLLQPS